MYIIHHLIIIQTSNSVGQYISIKFIYNVIDCGIHARTLTLEPLVKFCPFDLLDFSCLFVDRSFDRGRESNCKYRVRVSHPWATRDRLHVPPWLRHFSFRQIVTTCFNTEATPIKYRFDVNWRWG